MIPDIATEEERAAKEILLLVDDQDRFLGKYAPRHEAHSGEGLHHRAFVCSLFDSHFRILLQERKHRLWDKLWDLSVASHPLHLQDRDESYAEAASRALTKELGITDAKMSQIGGFNYFVPHPEDNRCENEYCAILVGRYDGEVTPREEAVYSRRWVDFEAFLREVRAKPANFTPWARLATEILEQQGVQKLREWMP